MTIDATKYSVIDSISDRASTIQFWDNDIIYIKLKDGFAVVDTVFTQYACNLISFDSAAYAKCLVNTIPYLPTGTTFEQVNTAGRWFFTNPPATFDPSVATNWKGGVVPAYIGLNSWNTNGQQPMIKLSGRSL